MAARKFNILFVFLVSSCALANDSVVIKIINKLSACTSITNTAILSESIIPVLSFDLVVDKPIAECGCKSSLGSYAVYSSSGEYKSLILVGKIGLMASARKFLPLSAEHNLINNRELIVEFSCAQPD